MTLLKYYIRFVLFIVLSLVFSFHLYATDNAGPILIISSYNPDTRYDRQYFRVYGGI